MLFAAPLAFEPAAFTLESARAAMQLGPVEFVCNTCGKLHTTLESNVLDLCVCRRCRMAWARAYDDYHLFQTHDAAAGLRNDLSRATHGRMHNVIANMRVGELAWSCLINLAHVLNLLDPRLDGEGRRSAVQIIFAQLTRGRSQRWLLMVPEERADVEIGQGLVILLSNVLSHYVPNAIRDARLIACSCDYPASQELNASCAALQAEADRLCRIDIPWTALLKTGVRLNLS